MSVLRRARQSFTWLALGVFLAGVSMPVWDEHPLAADDIACHLGEVLGGSDVTHVDAGARGTGQPAHCVFCHLQRALAGATPASLVVLLAPESAALAARLVEDAPAAAVFCAHASRAPPASSVI